MDKVAPYLNALDADLSSSQFFTLLEEKTKVRKSYLLLGSLAFLLLLVVFGVGSQFICNIVGFVYPAYASFKAIQTTRKDDDTAWLTYWVSFALFCVLESVVDVVGVHVPGYFVVKFVALIWMAAPQTKGAQVVYDKLISRFLVKHESTIDSAINNVKDAVRRTADSASDATNHAADAVRLLGERERAKFE
jgi:receptor expression-enhancing protein 5/6